MSDKLSPEELATLANMEQAFEKERAKPVKERSKDMPDKKTQDPVGVILSQDN